MMISFKETCNKLMVERTALRARMSEQSQDIVVMIDMGYQIVDGL